ncbi:hypothetical protein N7540_004288 [Penicillium herquei]|nr:hypothetical protein N7540_004288 [Penicillium herquei]
MLSPQLDHIANGIPPVPPGPPGSPAVPAIVPFAADTVPMPLIPPTGLVVHTVSIHAAYTQPQQP